MSYWFADELWLANITSFHVQSLRMEVRLTVANQNRTQSMPWFTNKNLHYNYLFLLSPFEGKDPNTD